MSLTCPGAAPTHPLPSASVPPTPGRASTADKYRGKKSKANSCITTFSQMYLGMESPFICICFFLLGVFHSKRNPIRMPPTHEHSCRGCRLLEMEITSCLHKQVTRMPSTLSLAPRLWGGGAGTGAGHTRPLKM